MQRRVDENGELQLSPEDFRAGGFSHMECGHGHGASQTALVEEARDAFQLLLTEVETFFHENREQTKRERAPAGAGGSDGYQCGGTGYHSAVHKEWLNFKHDEAGSLDPRGFVHAERAFTAFRALALASLRTVLQQARLDGEQWMDMVLTALANSEIISWRCLPGIGSVLGS